MSVTIGVHSPDTPESLQKNSGFLPDNILHSVHRPVFFTSAGLIIAFSLYGGGFSEQAGAAFMVVQDWLVTSSDSGSLVIDIITSGGKEDPPKWQRIFWAMSEGVIAAVLLVAGGLGALQTAAISSASPFAVVMLFMCYGLYQGLLGEENPGRQRS